MFPVRYELNSYINLLINSVFKGLMYITYIYLFLPLHVQYNITIYRTQDYDNRICVLRISISGSEFPAELYTVGSDVRGLRMLESSASSRSWTRT
jgi:uncharacterized membrane protein YcgQ (UPF0703/DUF1980 family)